MGAVEIYSYRRVTNTNWIQEVCFRVLDDTKRVHRPSPGTLLKVVGKREFGRSNIYWGYQQSWGYQIFEFYIWIVISIYSGSQVTVLTTQWGMLENCFSSSIFDIIRPIFYLILILVCIFQVTLSRRINKEQFFFSDTGRFKTRQLQ